MDRVNEERRQRQLHMESLPQHQQEGGPPAAQLDPTQLPPGYFVAPVTAY